MKKSFLLVAVIILALSASVALAQVVPEGGTVTAGTPENADVASAGSDGAKGGYITEMNVSGESQTSVWQGYFGEVTGNITLEDSSGDTLYQWAWENTDGGEVYAVNESASAPTWANIAVQQDCDVGEDKTGTGSDEVSNTFTNATIQEAFDVGVVPFTTSDYSCRTNTYIDGATPGDNTNYWEVMLTDGGSNPMIFVTGIESDLDGFEADATTHDYQLIVPEDNRGDDTATTYYFYIELS